jgi:pyruvate dehydrogenase E1 component alpha subunit
MHVNESMNIDDISIRAKSYGMKGITLDGNDVITIYEETKKAKEYVKKNGPMLMVLNTYRWMGHSKSDAQVYRKKDEVEYWKEKCPIKRHREYLLENNIFTEKEIEALQQKAIEEVKKALEFAENSPEPKIENIFDDLYA